MKEISKEVYNALKTLQDYCCENKCCDDCSLYNKNDKKCSIRQEPPYNYKLKESIAYYFSERNNL